MLLSSARAAVAITAVVAVVVIPPPVAAIHGPRAVLRGTLVDPKQLALGRVRFNHLGRTEHLAVCPKDVGGGDLLTVHLFNNRLLSRDDVAVAVLVIDSGALRPARAANESQTEGDNETNNNSILQDRPPWPKELFMCSTLCASHVNYTIYSPIVNTFIYSALLQKSDTLVHMVQFDEEKSNERLAELRKREAENLTQILSQKYDIPYLDLSTVSINIDALRAIPETEARAAHIGAFNIVDKVVHVGILSPNTQESMDALNALSARGYSPSVYLISAESLNKILDRYKDLGMSSASTAGALEISNSSILDLTVSLTSLEAFKTKLQETIASKASYRISHFLEIIIAGALAQKASDIHIEPEEHDTRLRLRLDGVLTDIIHFDESTYNLVLSRIKLLSGLKLNIKNKAQDGRFSIKLKDSEVEIRTSLLPGAYNDSVVLRILNPDAISVPLEELGIHPRLLSVLVAEISKPNGMLLNTGPTGSGKTTTLYAFLKKIHTPDIKIITIENPIEYHLPGIVQTQTTAEYSFLEGLRSSLRQDPDVIMVGEIRDTETAEIAVNAALTGHLVFSTLHTNNAAGTYPRLIDLGVNPKVITSALSLCMAQRLVRKLCIHCKQEKILEGEDKALVEKIVASIADKTYLEGVDTQKIYLAHGCDKCNFTGYKGRIGVYEAIVSDRAIEEVVQKNPSEREIRKAALPQNLLNMQQDGVIKILNGTTSLEELSRVVDLKEELY